MYKKLLGVSFTRLKICQVSDESWFSFAELSARLSQSWTLIMSNKFNAQFFKGSNEMSVSNKFFRKIFVCKLQQNYIWCSRLQRDDEVAFSVIN